MTVTGIPGDCTAVLPTLMAGSVPCCVTSPPYGGLRASPHAPTGWPDRTFVPVAGLPDLTVPAQVCQVGAESDPWSSIAPIGDVFRDHGAPLAVFPEDIPARGIQAGSAPQASAHCGAPGQRGGARGAPDPRRPPSGRALMDGQSPCTCPAPTGSGRRLVLDPFGGSGTTGAVAERLGRDPILMEAAADYRPRRAQRTATYRVPRRPPPPPPRRDVPVPGEER